MSIQLFELAVTRFDDANRADPRKVTLDGQEIPFELLYAQRMSHWLDRLDPNASEAVRLAARSQHIRRWEIPRSDYAMDRAGYYQWRIRLYGYHAEKAGEILREVGYDDATIMRVQQLLQKKNIKTDPEMQLLEDVICVVFLENYFADFSQAHEPDKVVDILQKTWRKMSPRGQQAALGLKIPDAALKLVERALGSS